MLRGEMELAAAVKEIGRNVMGIQGDVSNLGDLDRSLPKSRGRNATLILCSRMLVLRHLPPSAQLPGITMTQSSTSM
jgi:hypothetical protein